MSRALTPLCLFALVALVYVAMLGDRALTPSPDNHYVHLAAGWLDGRIGLAGAPPGTNDWACVDTETGGLCPPGRYEASERYRWYVSFPPFPAVVLLPAVAVLGLDVPDRLFFALFAALGPALLYVLLRRLRERGLSARRAGEDVVLALLFAFGTVYFFVSVQGTVWFAAHVVATPLLIGYVYFSLGARRPLAAGLCLAAAFLCRPTTALMGVFFAAEAFIAARGAAPSSPGLFATVRAARPSLVAAKLGLFALPLLAMGVAAMWHNEARFGDPLEWGHSYLQIRWRPRIERWGLFDYHYLGRNLSVFLASLPWVSDAPPYVTISRHGLALWVTTPALLWALFPRRWTPPMVGLAAAIVPVMLTDLLYQNSGWVQFGYRFALDYLPLVFALLALGGRRFGAGFYALFAFSVAVNAFGAATFDRDWRFYDADPTQQVYFQPD